jgi:uncharacterized caspase-like protein
MRFTTYITGSWGKAFAVLALTLALGLGLGTTAKADGPLPKLYVVSVGINNYQFINKTNVCAKDAQEVSALLQAQEGKLFGHVEAKTLIDSQATAANISAALRWAHDHADANSYVIVFFAGHGNKTANGEYVYMAYDTHPMNPNSVVSWGQMKAALDDLPGKSILMLNSCFSGAVTSTKTLTVLSSSLSTQVSFERPRSNGYFTFAVLEGLSGKADKNGDGTVTLAELSEYVVCRVTEVSCGLQVPVTMWPTGAANVQTPMTQVGTTTVAIPVTPVRDAAMAR